MKALKILWTNDKVLFSYENKEETIFIDDNIFIDRDKKHVSDLIEAAVKSIGYSGFHVNIFYEGRNIDHDLVKAPLGLVKPKEVRNFIDHRIQSKDISPAFERQMFSFTLGDTNKDHRNILIDFFNIHFVHCLVYSFDKLGISVDILSSVSPILSSLSRKINSSSPFIVNYITDFGLNDFQFYCNSDKGIPSFIRYTPPYDNVSDINDSINRSVLYGKQQFYGVEPDIYLVGDFSKNVCLEDFPDYDIKFIGDDSNIWDAINVIKNNVEGNVIPQSERGKKEQSQRFNFLLFFMLFGFLMSACFYLGTLYLADNKEKESLKFFNYEASLIKKENIYKELIKDDERNNAILRPYSDLCLRVIGNIANLFKEKVILTNFSSERSKNKDGSYVVKYSLSGYVYTDPILAAKILKEFEKTISGSPFNFEVTESWKNTWLSNIENWKKSSSRNRTVKSGIKFHMSGNVYER